MEKIFLESSDFQNTGRGLNFASIKNSNVVDAKEFAEITKGKRVHSEADMKDLIQKAANRAEFDADAVIEARAQIGKLKRVVLQKAMGQHETFFVQDLPPQSDDLEKGGSISSSLFYRNDVTFKKTGKEIITQLNSLIAATDSRLEVLSSELSTGLEEISRICTLVPDQPLDSYETEELDEADIVGLKRFSYDLTYFNDPALKSYTDHTNGESQSGSSTKQQAQAISKYNENVRKILNCKKEKAYLNVFARNLDETKSYDLNLETLKNLKF